MEFPTLGGRVRLTDAVPFEHGMVTGSPGSGGLDEYVQVLARVTVAETVTLPPVAGRLGGTAA